MNHLKNISVFFSLSILFLFAGCSLLLVYAQIQGYQNLEQSIQRDSELYTPMAYLTNKIHNYDEQGAISLTEIQGIQCLKLQDEKTDTYIYGKEGSLQELYTLRDWQPNLNSGQKLMKCDSLRFIQTPSWIEVVVNGQSLKIPVQSGGVQ